jgi:EAL and modified HD-GYP domain-containing signal transduction protein
MDAMFEFLRRIGGGAARAPAPQEARADAPEVGPFAPVPPAAAMPQQDFVRRETLLERSGQIAGYAFCLVLPLQDRLSRRGATARSAYDAALLTRLTLGGGASLLGQRLAFVSLAADSVNNPVLARVPAQNTVLMLDGIPADTDWQWLAAQASRLQAMGFFMGLQVQDASALDCPLLAELDFVQIDVAGLDGLGLRELVTGLRKHRSTARPRLRLVAHNLQSHDEFLFAQKCGFDYFHGPFVASQPGPRPAPSGGINRLVVLPILNMVRSDADFARIADQLKNEPTLSYKLLRYLNSPAMGLQVKIESLTEALSLVGRDKFYRWMSLLLFDFTNPSYQDRMLSERALTRGRTLELLAGQGRIPASPELLFLTGLFSLLDQTLGLPMADLLSKAALPEPVSQALLGQPGEIFDALQLVALGEADAALEAERQAQALWRCGIDDGAFAVAATQALVWAHDALGDAE